LTKNSYPDNLELHFKLAGFFMFERLITQELKMLSKGYPVITVVGPRQSGKTTLVRYTFPEKPYVNLEALDSQEMAKADPRGFLDRFPDGVILGEIQRVPELLSYIQVIVDEKDLLSTLEDGSKDSAIALEDILRDIEDDSDLEVGVDETSHENLDEMLESAEDAPVVRIVNSIMIEALRKHASDIHIEPMEKEIVVRFRIDGVLFEITRPPKQAQAAAL